MSMADDFIDTFYGDREFTNFGAQLFRLIAKADAGNRARLNYAFPAHIQLYEWWMGTNEPPPVVEVRSYAEFLEANRR